MKLHSFAIIDERTLGASFVGHLQATFRVLAIFASCQSAVSAHIASAQAEDLLHRQSSPELQEQPFALSIAGNSGLRTDGCVPNLRFRATHAGPTDRRKLTNRENDQRLSVPTLAQFKAISCALTKYRIPVPEVLTGEFCRPDVTGVRFGLDAPVRNQALNDPLSVNVPAALSRSSSGIRAIHAQAGPSASNRSPMGHQLRDGFDVHFAVFQLAEVDVAILNPEGSGRFHHVASFSPGQWLWITRKATTETVRTGASSSESPAAPVIDPATELKGAALISALRKGGFNLYMRHAQSNVGQDGNLINTPKWWANCAIQRNISDPGREQARKVGASIRELAIPVKEIVAAQFCRTRDTAHLMGLGPIEVSEDINHQIGQRPGFDFNAARFRRLATIPATGTNTVLVSHTHGSPRQEERIMGGIQEAEIVVYRPDGKGSSEPVARIPVADWDALVNLQNSAQQH